MRVVMAGDKSRYHFFRSIVDLNKSRNQENLFTERLGDRDIFLTSDIRKSNDDVFYSPRIPLNTELFFQSEYSDLLKIVKNDDKVIIFDEFPYATDRNMEKLKELLNSGNVGQVAVVLFRNHREHLETDISTDDMALEEAEKKYYQNNVPVFKYIPNSFPSFLLWKNDFGSIVLDGTLCSKMAIVKLNVDTFDSSYEFMFNSPDENGQNLAALVDFDVLASFCEYDRKLKCDTVWKRYHDRAYKFYWENNYAIKSFCKFIYQEAISEICIWDFEKDFEKLYGNITDEFKKIIDDIEPVGFEGSKADYDEFIRGHQEQILLYKTRIQWFFKEKMKDILRDRVGRNLLRLEALFS